MHPSRLHRSADRLSQLRSFPKPPTSHSGESFFHIEQHFTFFPDEVFVNAPAAIDRRGTALSAPEGSSGSQHPPANHRNAGFYHPESEARRSRIGRGRGSARACFWTEAMKRHDADLSFAMLPTGSGSIGGLGPRGLDGLNRSSACRGMAFLAGVEGGDGITPILGPVQSSQNPAACALLGSRRARHRHGHTGSGARIEDCYGHAGDLPLGERQPTVRSRATAPAPV